MAEEDATTTAMNVPTEDLTCHNFGTRDDDLTDRELFAWAYQTETKIRFQKLQAQTLPRKSTADAVAGTAPESGTAAASSVTTPPVKTNQPAALVSDYLIYIYPQLEKHKHVTFKNILERDRAAFQRKAIPCLGYLKAEDGSLKKIKIETLEDDTERPFQEDWMKNNLPVPSNFLFFEIILECYMGYKLPGLYNSNNPSMPRAAVMGGAVLWALNGWAQLRQHFEALDFEELLGLGKKRKLGDEEDADAEERLENYRNEKDELMKVAHASLLLISQGDVDIFLQCSPLMRQCRKKLDADYRVHIQRYLADIGWCHDDLRRYSESVLGLLDPIYQTDGKFVHSLTKNGLSFMYAPFSPDQYDPENEDYKWPRNTQIIMLDPRADLLGALMDFDISTACCAYDGITVRVTPRAALSLQRGIVVVTPFCFEEKRNQKRILKYRSRGFLPRIIDPSCKRQTELPNYDVTIKNYSIARDIPSGGNWRSNSFRTQQEYNAIIALQESSMENGANRVWCCCEREIHKFPYSMALFEKTEYDATEFFANIFNWDEERRRQVEEVPNHLRKACRYCRNQYGITQFLKDEAPLDDTLCEEPLKDGDRTFKFSRGYCGQLCPSFYGGPTFDGHRVGSMARKYPEAVNVLVAQSKAEKTRYFIKHGNLHNYRPRFLHTKMTVDDPLKQLFEEASKITFDTNIRRPIGLNPERFIAQCESCGDWLHGCEYGTKFCVECDESKPAAT